MRRVSKPGIRSIIGAAAVAGLCIGGGCSPAYGQDQGSWRCDAPNGSYQVNEPPIAATTTSISGQIAFHKPYVGSDWSSMARIGFVDGEAQDGDCHCNGLFVKAFPDEAKVGFFMLVDGEAVPLSSRPFGIPITFNISINPQGVMTVRVGKDYPVSKAAPLPHTKRDTLLMSCSGADVSFLNVRAG